MLVRRSIPVMTSRVTRCAFTHLPPSALSGSGSFGGLSGSRSGLRPGFVAAVLDRTRDAGRRVQIDDISIPSSF